MKLILLGCSAIALVMTWGWLTGVRCNFTPSMPRGIYRVTAAAPTRGDLVAFCLEGDAAALALARGYVRPGRCPSGAQPLVKRLIGLPGDSLIVSAAGLIVNGAALPASSIKEIDSHGRAMPPRALASGVIPLGLALVFSDACPGGFDGRYFGLVAFGSLARVEPLVITP